MIQAEKLASERSFIVKSIAREMGFDFVGISKAEKLEKEADYLESWLSQQRHGSMAWLANHFDKRTDPRVLVPGAQSVISLLLNYYPEDVQKEPNAPRMSRYAYGEDYHSYIRQKLRAMVERIQEEIGDIQGRVFVDSAPVMDKAWAVRSGLGWMGKHTNLIHPKRGSYFFIAEIISDLELQPDGPIKDYCGSCTRCLDACPTDAILSPHVLDASRCISYLTIELKEEMPAEFKGKMENWMFGCDICQEVCPWNRFAKPHNDPVFDAPEGLMEMKKSDWYELTEEVFDRVLGRSAVKRTGYARLMRNLRFLQESPEGDE